MNADPDNSVQRNLADGNFGLGCSPIQQFPSNKLCRPKAPAMKKKPAPPPYKTPGKKPPKC